MYIDSVDRNSLKNEARSLVVLITIKVPYKMKHEGRGLAPACATECGISGFRHSSGCISQWRVALPGNREMGPGNACR